MRKHYLLPLFAALLLLGTAALAQPLTGPGNALPFNGSNTRIVCGTGNRGISNRVTVEAWVKSSSAAYQWVAAKYSNSNFEDGGFFLYFLNGRVGFDGRCGVGQYFSSGTSGATYNDGRWHHLAGVFTGNEWQIYADGLLASSRSYAINAPNLTTTQPLALGYYPAQNAQYLDGDLDEVRVWRTARTALEIRDDMCRKIAPAPALVAYYNFDQSSGTTLPDQGSQPVVGVLSAFGAAPWRLSGAALGDVSTHRYRTGGLAPGTLTLAATSGDSAVATVPALPPGACGAQLYAVNRPPSISAGAGAASNYFGVFVAHVAAPQASLPFRVRLRPVAGASCRTAAQRPANDNPWVNLPLVPSPVSPQSGSLQSGPLAGRGEFIVDGQATSVPLAISGDTALCPGATARLTAAAGAAAYRWNTGATTAGIIVTQAGTYTVSATTTSGCVQQASVRVRAAVGVPKFSLGPDTTLCDGETLVLSGPAGPGLRYLWSDSSTGARLTVGRAGVYSLRVSNNCGLEQVNRTVGYRPTCVVVPNIITPNNDATNDLFAVQGLSGEAWELNIYNRWGRAVFQTSNYRNTWGREAPAGIYYVLLHQASTSYTYKGWLEVVR